MSENDQNNLPAAEDGGADDALDARLTRHLAAELDGQRGRSLAAFRLYEAAERNAAMKRNAPRPIWRGGPWTFAVVGGAVAASIALMVTTISPFIGNAPKAGGVPQPRPVVNMSTPVVRTDSTTRTHFYDAGTVYDEQGRPMRRIRKVNVQEIRWRNDATGEQVEQVVPTEEDVLYELKTY